MKMYSVMMYEEYQDCNSMGKVEHTAVRAENVAEAIKLIKAIFGEEHMVIDCWEEP